MRVVEYDELFSITLTARLMMSICSEHITSGSFPS
jgi:hypothetical protein